MDELLKSVLGGQGGNPLTNLLGNVLGGGTPQSQTSGNPMGNLLGNVFGGGTPQPQASGNPMTDLINSFINGGGMQNGGTMASLVSMAMGGATGSSPLVDSLSQRLGLPPMVAQSIVSYFVTKLLSAQMGQFGGGGLQSAMSAMPGGLNLDSLLNMVSNPQALSNQLNNSGMPQELAQHAGISPMIAAQGLQELVRVVGEQVQRGNPQQDTSGGWL